MDTFFLAITVVGLAALSMVWLPTLLKKQPFSYAIVFMLFGALVYLLPFAWELPRPDPIQYEYATIHLTELAVIITLMGTGVKLDRAFSWAKWKVPILLASVVMMLCIAALGMLGWWVLGLTPAAAILLGAAMAPTDPVLASDVQVEGPREGEEDHVRFSLTAEAGLNDGAAFPFTWLAVVVAGVTVDGGAWDDLSWLGEWLWYYLLFKIVVGVGIGYLVGRLVAYVVFQLPNKIAIPRPNDGFLAIALTLVVYGVTELVGGYGFMAVFFAGFVFARQERKHEIHKELHDFTDQIERILLVVVLILFGGSLVSGLLDHLTWEGALVGLGFVFVIRPLASMLVLIGRRIRVRERLAISFFGIRGVGSFFYLSFGLHQPGLSQKEELWAIAGFIVVLSIVVHGITAYPVMRYLDKHRTWSDLNEET
jgi:NhaP-type Na+/H+ or K+/H+ antiporter